jgi:IS1 family transposase
MNKLSREERTRVVAALVEGNSIRATVRMTGAAKNTVVKLLAELGAACADYHDANVRGLKSKRIQCDEIWSFCYAKEKNVPAEKRGKFGYGDMWTWTAIDPDSKLIVSYHIGDRDGWTAFEFMRDVKWRIATERIQITTDGFRGYIGAVGATYGTNVDFATLVKLYGLPSGSGAERRYSPSECVGVQKQTISGAPNPRHISTSFVERQNLTMRMGMRRFTRLTNGFSKKAENLAHAVALHFMHYNFCRVHQTLRVTPAMEAGIADHVWTLGELIGLLETVEQRRSA